MRTQTRPSLTRRQLDEMILQRLSQGRPGDWFPALSVFDLAEAMGVDPDRVFLRLKALSGGRDFMRPFLDKPGKVLRCCGWRVVDGWRHLIFSKVRQARTCKKCGYVGTAYRVTDRRKKRGYIDRCWECKRTSQRRYESLPRGSFATRNRKRRHIEDGWNAKWKRTQAERKRAKDLAIHGAP